MASTPQFEFGFGMSYTTFAYSDLLVKPKAANIGSPITVSITVKNTGKRAGNESVQLYVNDLVASISPPGKRLRRFAKVHLEPGQSKTLVFTLISNDLSFVAAQNKSIVEPGDFDVMIGGLTERFTLAQAP